MKNLVLLFACAVVGIAAFSHDLRADYIVTGDVDLYKQPGGKGKPIGIVRGSETQIYPTINCRSDKWCQIPGKGWVWGDFVKEVAAAKPPVQPQQSAQRFCCYAAKPGGGGGFSSCAETEAAARPQAEANAQKLGIPLENITCSPAK